jgi:hypothetical protein
VSPTTKKQLSPDIGNPALPITEVSNLHNITYTRTRTYNRERGNFIAANKPKAINLATLLLLVATAPHKKLASLRAAALQ